MPTLNIISAKDRVNEIKGIKGCIFGKSGIGKTSLLWTLPPEKTLFFELEAGDLPVKGWQGDTVRPQTWQECRDMAVLIGGANPALRSDQIYSEEHYDAVLKQSGDVNVFDKYDTIFIDSITVAARWCLGWCDGQPQAFSERTGKPDKRGAYGLHAQQMIAWLTHLQHARHKNIWFVGILDEKTDDFNRRFFEPQMEGKKTGLELPGIVDEVITMAEIVNSDNRSYRAFICQTLNPHGYPAKDRSTCLDMMEEPHLGKLMKKISNGAKPAAERLTYTLTESSPSTKTDTGE